MSEIRYTTTSEQIEKLKTQGLLIADEQKAEQCLQIAGYSNLIKSYRSPYIIRKDSQIEYRSNVTFEQIYSLYCLDKNLRNSVMAAMQDLEEHLKAVTADVIAQSFGTDPKDYLCYKNYRNKRKRNPKFSLRKILDQMWEASTLTKEPVYHYAQKYGIVPPWILFNSAYFSTIVNFVDHLKPAEQEKVALQLYDTSILKLSSDSLRKLMMDTLFLCIEYRNMSAHGERIYNHTSKNKVRYGEIFSIDDSSGTCSFNELLLLLSLLRYSAPHKRLATTLQAEINRHCSAFQMDTTYLGQTLNLNIKIEKKVWVSENSRKYHVQRHCSGIQGAHLVALDEARSSGYSPCKRCCRQILI